MNTDNKTLGEHAREFWMDRGIDTSKLDPDQKQKSYELWVMWAFSDMGGNEEHRQNAAMKDIVEWEATL